MIKPKPEWYGVLNKISPQMSKISPKEFDYIFKRGVKMERERILKIIKRRFEYEIGYKDIVKEIKK